MIRFTKEAYEKFKKDHPNEPCPKAGCTGEYDWKDFCKDCEMLHECPLNGAIRSM